MLNLRPSSGPEGPTPGHDSGSDSATAHLDRIPIDDDGPGGPELGDDPEHQAEHQVLSRDQFRQGFRAAFLVAGAGTGLRSLTTAPERPEADPAADALYDIAAESPWLRWLIQPQGLWLQRCVALGAFALPVAAGVRAELVERAAAAAPDA